MDHYAAVEVALAVFFSLGVIVGAAGVAIFFRRKA